jgi:hypothetical protein
MNPQNIAARAGGYIFVLFRQTALIPKQLLHISTYLELNVLFGNIAIQPRVKTGLRFASGNTTKENVKAPG